MSRHHKVFFAAAALGAAAIGFLGACTSPQPSPWAPPKPIDPMGERSAGSPASDRDPDGSHSPAESSRPESGSRTQRVYFGIDHLEGNRFRELKGKRIGLITNQTSINRNRVPTRKVLQDAPQIDLVALFVPEHGIDGKEQASRFIPTRKDPLTGLTAYSLYGPTRKPTKEMLDGLDVLAFDLQDIGSRSYTYLSTMILAMGACGEHGVEFAVFDRPNPLGGERVCGPPMEKDWISFVGQFPAPYCHGMTAGELAMMANAEGWTTHPCDISIIRMRNWRRNMTWDDTGLPWVATSPNIPRSDSPLYYASTGIFGSLTGGDIGIGTRKPFEIVGAPGIDADELTRYLNGFGMPGIKFTPYRSLLRPGYAGSQLHLDPQAPIDIAGLNLIFIDVISRRVEGDMFHYTSASGMNLFHKVYGSNSLRDDLASGKTPAQIIVSWKAAHERFRNQRKPYLLYR